MRHGGDRWMFRVILHTHVAATLIVLFKMVQFNSHVYIICIFISICKIVYIYIV